ncbi:MAG TPA: MerR family transcriptional regulator [Bacteroidetes bacterium]|nr:MerR family transcriptional regulator [Bacteroidota bacterium]
MAKTAPMPDALYSISQVNALTGVPKSTIRFWEKEFNQFLSPLRTAGNQRRYDSKAVEIIARINQLVNTEGYTLEGARRKMSDLEKSFEKSQNNTKGQLNELAETMSDYLLQKLFERVRQEESGRDDDFK